MACSLHAPWKKVEAWWVETTRLLRLHVGLLPAVLCMDANTQIMACDTDLVGAVGVNFEHAYHTAMYGTVMDCEIRMPGTMEQFAHRGVEGTYHTSTGMVRIDYVGIMGGCTAVNKSSVTWPKFDMMTDNDDHRPTALKVIMPAKAVSALERRRAPCYDRSNTADKAMAAQTVSGDVKGKYSGIVSRRTVALSCQCQSCLV